jgi:hypothetical protein
MFYLTKHTRIPDARSPRHCASCSAADPGAAHHTSRPSNRGMRGVPSMGVRGMRGGMGSGRMNGGMRGRR